MNQVKVMKTVLLIVFMFLVGWLANSITTSSNPNILGTPNAFWCNDSSNAALAYHQGVISGEGVRNANRDKDMYGKGFEAGRRIK